MFAGCTNLEKLPKLPLVLKTDSCKNMFNGCTKIKVSTTQTSEYNQEYKIPSDAEATSFTNMFTNTGGTFTETPVANTTYYTSNMVI